MYLWSVSHDIWTIWWYIVFIVWPFTQLGMWNTDRVWICSSHFSRHDNRTTQILHVHSIILPTYAFNGSNCWHRSPIKYPHYPASNLHYSVQVIDLAPWCCLILHVSQYLFLKSNTQQYWSISKLFHCLILRKCNLMQLTACMRLWKIYILHQILTTCTAKSTQSVAHGNYLQI